MKITVIFDKEREEEVLIYARERTALIDSIEQLVTEDSVSLIGYSDREAVPLDLDDICFFTVEANKVFAVTDSEKFQLKHRLYKIEEQLPKRFVKINQSCIANIKKIKRFDASVSGTLTVIFQNGDRDFVSRRNLKNVNERLGL